MIRCTLVLRRQFSNEVPKRSLTSLKKRMNEIQIQSQPYVNKMVENLKTAKQKSIVGLTVLSDWLSKFINTTTGYDEITKIEQRVNESERKFEYTTKHLRELNTEYLNHEERVMSLQMERTELMMKPKRTVDENKRLSELVANENEWEKPLEDVRKDYLNLFELQKSQLEKYKEDIYKRYYEERAWEQKIRRLGQYSYIAMLGLNVITFGYTRYDRIRIRKNMELSIKTSDALMKHMAQIQQSQNEIYEENKRLLTGVRDIVSEIQETTSLTEEAIVNSVPLTTGTDDTSVELGVTDEKNELRESVNAITAAVERLTQRNAILDEEKSVVIEEAIITAHSINDEKVQINAIMYVLSSIATFAVMSLLFH